MMRLNWNLFPFYKIAFLFFVLWILFFGCKEDPIEIIPLEIRSQVTHVSQCAGCDGAIDILVSGGVEPYTYLWSNDETTQDIDSLNAGLYWLQVTDNADQVHVDTFEVKEPNRDVFLFSKKVTNVSTYNGSDGAVNISIEGGVAPYTFEWSNGEITEDVENLIAGQYWVKITDAVDSVLVDSTQIEQPELQELVLVLTKQDISEYGETDGVAYCEVTGGLEPYSYSWSNGCTKNEAQKLPQGIISLTVTDVLGTTVTDSITINEPEPNAILLELEYVNPSETGAQDGWIKAIVSGGYPPFIFEWSNGMKTETIDGLSADNYQLKIIDSKDQEITDSIILVDILTDIDGNEYAIVKIGDQTWMKENLKVTHAPDGSEITSYAYNNDENNVETYGRLYTWYAAMNGSVIEKDQGVCPSGWHIPSDEEVQILEIELGMTETEAAMVNIWRGSGIGTSMKVGGESGFDAVLSGRRNSNGSFRLLGQYEYTWTSTEYAGGYAWRRCLDKNAHNVGRWNTFPKNYGFSVRCIKNE